jgi:hypothetical protein
VAWFDADGQHRSQDLATMLDEMRKHDYDALFGARTTDSAVVKSRVAGKAVLAFVARFVVEQKIPDINCGLRIFKRTGFVPYLPLLPDGFSASTTSTLLYMKRNKHLRFHPVITGDRAGTSSVRQVRDGLRTLHLMMRVLVLFSAFRAFTIASICFGSVGTAYGMFWAIVTGRGFPVLASVFILAGVIIFFMGILCDQISALRIELLERGSAD